MDTVPRATNDSLSFHLTWACVQLRKVSRIFPQHFYVAPSETGEIDHRHNNLIKWSYLCVLLTENAVHEYPIEE